MNQKEVLEFKQKLDVLIAQNDRIIYLLEKIDGDGPFLRVVTPDESEIKCTCGGLSVCGIHSPPLLFFPTKE